MVSAPKVTFEKGFKNDFNISMTGLGLCDAPRLENECLDRNSCLNFISATLFGGNMSNAYSIYPKAPNFTGPSLVTGPSPKSC